MARPEGRWAAPHRLDKTDHPLTVPPERLEEVDHPGVVAPRLAGEVPRHLIGEMEVTNLHGVGVAGGNRQ